VFFILWLGYKFYYRTKTIPAAQVDLVTGKQQIDAEEADFITEQELRGPLTRRQKLWDAL
jgi:yeast amino acid transporter